jgi:hypothetical protein
MALDSVGRVVVPLVEPGVEAVPPAPRRPKPPPKVVASLAGTPWASRHAVNLAREALPEPDVAEPDVAEPEVAEPGEVVLVGAVADLAEPPPQAVARAATASIGATRISALRARRGGRPVPGPAGTDESLVGITAGESTRMA